MISYGPLAKQLQEKNIKKTELKKICNLSSVTLAKLGKNETVSLSIIDRICQVLNCRIDEVVEIKIDK